MSEVVHTMDAWLEDPPYGRQALPIDCRYNADEPCALRLDIHTERRVFSWQFARSIALGGLVTKTGKGRVRFEPHRERIFTQMTLQNYYGRAVLLLPNTPWERFLESTLSLIPLGEAESQAQQAIIERELVTIVSHWR